MRARLGTALRQLPSYRATLSQMLRELWSAFPGTMVTLTGLSVVGAMLRGVTLAAGVRYLQLLEADASLTLSSVALGAREPAVMRLATLGLVALLGLSAWLLFRARMVTARLLEAYQAHQLERIVNQVPLAVPGVRPPRTAQRAADLVARIVMRDAQQSAVLVRFLGRAIPAIVTLAYAVPLILYLDHQMTIALAALFGMSLPLFYRANVMAYESGVIGKTSQQGAARQLQEWLVELQDYGSAPRVESRNAADRVVKGPLQRRLGVLPMYLRSLARTELVINVLMCAALGLILILQVPHALSGTQEWTAILAYFIFLRLAIDGFDGVFGFLNIFSKIYPSTRRYQEFANGPVALPDGAPAVQYRAHARGMLKPGIDAEARDAQTIAIWSRLAVTRFSFPYIFRYGSDAPSGIVVDHRRTHLVGPGGLPARSGSIRSMLQVPLEATSDELLAKISGELREEIERNFGRRPDLDSERSAAAWRRISLPARVEIGLLAGAWSMSAIVVVGSASLAALSAGVRQEVMRLLHAGGARIMIVHAEHMSHAAIVDGSFGATVCAIVGARGDLFALARPDWIAAHLPEIRHLLAEERNRIKNETSDAAFEDIEGD